MPDSYVTHLRRHVGTDCIHLPGIRAIVLNDLDEVLLQRRIDMKLWGLPAGAVELNETVYEALHREISEETGIVIQSAEPIALYSGPRQRFQYPNGDQVQGFGIIFIVREWTGRPRADGVEGSELKFWPFEALPMDMVPLHAQTLRYYRDYHGRFMLVQ